MSHLEPDPQLSAILLRVDAFEATVHDQAARISAMRNELDGLWVTRRGEGSDEVSWVFRPRSRKEQRRSA
jgi:hypothetical protein